MVTMQSSADARIAALCASLCLSEASACARSMAMLAIWVNCRIGPARADSGWRAGADRGRRPDHLVVARHDGVDQHDLRPWLATRAGHGDAAQRGSDDTSSAMT
jgi:hypothetical protein